jgi:hypothetical protein
VIIATSTWNSADLIETWLRHQEALRATAVLVMDYGSTDGTREILRSPRWSQLVRMYDVQALEADASNDLLAIAKASYSGSWCLYCDPDEFLVTPAMSLDDLLANTGEGISVVSVPRRNLTAPRSVANAAGLVDSPFEWLTLRIERRSTRTDAERFGEAGLSSPWIFTAILGKVLVQVDQVDLIGPGDHSAHAGVGETCETDNCVLLHFPFRGFDRFRRKLELARRQRAVVGPQPPNIAWEYRRWLGLPDEAALRAEYEAQFVEDAKVPALLADGALTEDARVRDALRGYRQP